MVFLNAANIAPSLRTRSSIFRSGRLILSHVQILIIFFYFSRIRQGLTFIEMKKKISRKVFGFQIAETLSVQSNTQTETPIMEKTELDEHRPELRESTENEDADQHKFLTGIKLFLVMAAISLNTFMVSMVSLRSK